MSEKTERKYALYFQDYGWCNANEEFGIHFLPDRYSTLAADEVLAIYKNLSPAYYGIEIEIYSVDLSLRTILTIKR